jgi:hypothetical protein
MRFGTGDVALAAVITVATAVAGSLVLYGVPHLPWNGPSVIVGTTYGRGHR